MATIYKGTIGKKEQSTGIVKYIYPKTTADVVEYENNQSVKDKLDTLSRIVGDNATNINICNTTIGDNTSGLIKDVADLEIAIGNLDVATTTTPGLMSSEDKIKLDGIESNANKIIIDSELNINSNNPVRNRTIAEALNNKADIDHTHTIVNGHTVEADVPANAKFTDTTYTVVTDNISGLMPAESKYKLDNIIDEIINDISESDAMVYSSYALNKNYYSKNEIDALFAQIGWVGTLEDYNNLSIKNPRMIYTTINTNGVIKHFLGDIELKVDSHLIGETFIHLNGLRYDINNISSLTYEDITPD